MTEAQKRLRELRDRQSKQRQRMAELGLIESLSDEQRAELDAIEKGTQDLERQLRASNVTLQEEEKEAETRAADNPDAEQRERIALRSKASLTNFLMAALSGRQVDGVESELRSAAGITDGVPLELWDTADTRETRADTSTGAPSTVGINLDRIRPAVFANSIAPRLGIEMPRVASGTYASATITTSLTAGAKAKGSAQEATEAAFTVTSATPKRVSARLSIRVEDIASVGQANFESALRENLSVVLCDQLDKQAINGDGQAPNLSGILKRLTDPTAPTAVADFDAFVAAFADGIDGLWASTTKDISILSGAATYQLSAKSFRDVGTNNGHRGDISFADYAMTHGGGWWTNKRMPDAASDVQQAVLFRKGRAARTAVCPHWGQISIDDIFSESASGTRHFTAHVLLGDVILVQPDAYAQVAFKLA